MVLGVCGWIGKGGYGMVLLGVWEEEDEERRENRIGRLDIGRVVIGGVGVIQLCLLFLLNLLQVLRVCVGGSECGSVYGIGSVGGVYPPLLPIYPSYTLYTPPYTPKYPPIYPDPIVMVMMKLACLLVRYIYIHRRQ